MTRSIFAIVLAALAVGCASPATLFEPIPGATVQAPREQAFKTCDAESRKAMWEYTRATPIGGGDSLYLVVLQERDKCMARHGYAKSEGVNRYK